MEQNNFESFDDWSRIPQRRQNHPENFIWDLAVDDILNVSSTQPPIISRNDLPTLNPKILSKKRKRNS